ncbi:hypothetical protein PTSG_12229 [Salpingoeca rosetta]|uniref:Reverse transcriptase n=1 Tax=Salpingoeca rosetta (strain ATCC 50818 / BSB-021) TaxID=946362 RepID=F2U946_SALR5|nr:uncharacterized protein PTSG_12229 [Salpingoeca rosetta]EGD73249.1 hypothetical protein PTSG_12229 [Salpingoeca rosetta]|eukprot:XP_004994280.1 hypothetical protein PTSG_12229 [Salpingoeca rosetta]
MEPTPRVLRDTAARQARRADASLRAEQAAPDRTADVSREPVASRRSTLSLDTRARPSDAGPIPLPTDEHDSDGAGFVSSSVLHQSVGGHARQLALKAITYVSEDTDDLAGWLRRFRRAMGIVRVPEEEWVDMASLYMTGALGEWTVSRAFKSFDDFESSAIAAFGDPSQQWRARLQLAGIRQTGNIVGYIRAFRKLVATASMRGNDDLLVALFVNGIRLPSTRRELTIRQPVLLEDAISIALDLGASEQYDQRGGTRNNGSSARRDSGRPAWRSDRRDPRYQRDRRPRRQDRHTPSSINVVEDVQGLSICSVGAPTQRATVRAVVTGELDGEPRRMLLDTGADVSFASPHLLRDATSALTPVSLRYPNGTTFVARDAAHMPVKVPGVPAVTATLLAAPCPSDVDAVLGTDVLAQNDWVLSFVDDTVRVSKTSQLCSSSATTPTVSASPSHACVQCRPEPQPAPTSASRTPSTDISVKCVSATTVAAYVRRDEVEDVFVALVSAQRSDPTPAQPDHELDTLLHEYADVFSNDLPRSLPPRRPEDLRIRLQPGAKTPPYVRYKLSPPERDELSRQLKDLLRKGFIRPSSSPFAAPVLLVRKKDGSMRFCVDFRRLNHISIKDRYPLPDMLSVLAKCAGHRLYTTLDLCSGYHQLRVHPQDEDTTAFVCDDGQFAWRVMPFGIANGPPVFQRLMDRVTADIPGVLVYLDDIVVFSNTKHQHLRTLRRVFQRLRDERLALKPKKCEFLKPSLLFLGHVLSCHGISVDPDKVDAVMKLAKPSSKTELLSFLGTVNYYRRFLRNMEDIAAPLRELQDLAEWGEAHEHAFNALKQALCNATTLAPPDHNAPFIIRADASDKGIGAVLEQHGRPVEFMSKKLTSAEANYPIRQRELLAIVVALQKWRHYFGFSTVEVITDHKSLLDLQTQSKISERRILRWMETLAEFSIKWTYTPGVDNHVPDTLSRLVGSTTTALVPTQLGTNYEADSAYKKLLARLSPPFRFDGDVLLFHDRRCVVKSDIKAVLRHAHDAHGHPGLFKTLGHLSRRFFWPRMYSDAAEYIQGCHTCLMSKPAVRPTAPLQPLDVPPYPWHTVTCDFVSGFPTVRGFDTIAVYVDKLSKTVHLAPCSKTLDAAGAARLLVDTVVRHHGTPCRMISDRDPRFVSKVYKEVAKALGIKLSFSTASHPQTDGQSERSVQSVTTLLRCLVADNLRPWPDLLPLVEFCINSSPHAVTKVPPFQATQGFTPSLFPVDVDFLSPVAEDLIDSINATVQRCRDMLQYQNAVTTSSQTATATPFAEGEDVYVSSELLLDDQHRNKKRKLRPRFLGPVKIKRVLGPAHVTLQLPPGVHIHPTVNIKHLKKPTRLPRDVSRPPPLHGSDVYELESIQGHRTTRRGTQYLCKWKGYPSTENTYEHPDNLLGKDARLLLANYKQQFTQGENLTIWTKPLSEAGITLPAGLLPTNPATSCSAALAAGLTRSDAYFLRAGDDVFRGYCDQTTAGGGWLKILHGAGAGYGSAWTSANAGRALGDVSQESVSGLARLSDNTINAYLAAQAPYVYRFKSDCVSQQFYLKTGQTYNDAQFGMNLFGGGAVGCMSTNKCNPSDSRVISGYVPDNIGFVGDGCLRFFQGHVYGQDYPFQCYSPNKRSTNARCFSSGASCTCNQPTSSYAVHSNFRIFVKSFADF